MLKRKINQGKGAGSGGKIVRLNRMVREVLTEEVNEDIIELSEGRMFQAEETSA